MKAGKFFSLGNIMLAVVSLVLSIGAAEYFLRLSGMWFIPDYSAIQWYASTGDKQMPYLLKPNLSTSWGLGNIQTNELGLRESKPRSVNKDMVSILLVGDSIVFGFGVGQEDSIASLMSKSLNLNQKSPRYRVINGGIPGFNIENEARLLAILTEAYHPDIVVWLLVENDCDDSLGADSEGRLTFSGVDYVVNSMALKNWGYSGEAWGYFGEAFLEMTDFRKSMSAVSLAWAEGRPAPYLENLNSWFRSRSVLYAMLHNKLLPYTHSSSKPTASSVKYQSFYQSESGRHPFPHFASVYSSSRHIKKTVLQLEKTATDFQQLKIPLIVVNTSLPITLDSGTSSGAYRYYDISTYLGQPFITFLAKHNLGWDGHPNIQGNYLLSEAIKRILECSDLVDRESGTDCLSAVKKEDEIQRYWAAFREAKRDYTSHFLSYIDLEKFAGIPQILGGIFPPRLFPGPIAKRANMLLKISQGKTLRLLGVLPEKSMMKLEIKVFVGGNSLAKQAQLLPGAVDLGMDLSSLLNNSEQEDNLLEVQIECLEQSGANLQLKRVELS